MDFEKELMRGIPLEAAADFFIRIRGREKEASIDDAVNALAELPAAEREELLKDAAMPAGAAGAAPMASPAALPPAARGQQMHQQPAPALPPTAMGQNTTPGMKMAAKTPQESGEGRARANFAAALEKNRLTRGERWGGAAGGGAGVALGGLAGLGLAGHVAPPTALGGLAALGGAAGGAYLGHRAGKAVGAGAGHLVDKARFNGLPTSGPSEEKAAAAFKLALQDGGLSNQLDQQEPKPSNQAPPQQPGAPQAIQPLIDPATQELLAQEQAGNEAAEQNEAAYLREQLQAEREKAQVDQEQLATLSEAQANHDAQMAQIQAQVADSTQKSMAAQDQVLQQQQGAAAMRMAYQQLRGQLLEVASADPPAMAGDQAAMAASQAAGASSAPAPTAGPAGQAPAPGTPPGSPAPEGDATVSAPSQANEPMFGNAAPTTSMNQKEPTGDQQSINSPKEVLSHFLPFAGRGKVASLRDFLLERGGKIVKRLPHAAAGAALGAAGGAAESFTSNDPLRQKVQELEAKPDRGYRDTLSLAQHKARLTVGEFAEKHPAAMMGAGALTGGMMGFNEGPAVVDAAREAGGHIKGIGKNIKDIFSKGAA